MVVFGIGSKMSNILRFFKPLKESDLTPKSRESASKEVKKCEERTATVGIKRGPCDLQYHCTTQGSNKLAILIT